MIADLNETAFLVVRFPDSQGTLVGLALYLLMVISFPGGKLA
jgi:hypothetical protein